jgi:class 3 adenylate cyclase
MEPRIQYAHTKDGVSIAYAAAGKGRTLIFVPSPPLTHVQRLPQVYQRLWEGLAERFHFVWYDSRGSGLSDRDAIDFSMPAMMRDLEAVAESARRGQFALFAGWDGVPIAITYAATRLEHVSHLILVDGWVKQSDYDLYPAHHADLALREQDWVLYTETYGRVLMGFDDPVLAAAFGEYMRACVEPEALRAAFSSYEDYDVAEPAGQVTTPTLVLHNRRNRWLPVRVGQRLAARIPGARFLEIDDLIYQDVPRLVGDFISETGAIGAPEAPGIPSGTAVILFADIAESTALTERLGDAAFRDKARGLDAALRAVIRENGGTPIEGKLLGDGVLAVFTSARQAIEAALGCGKAGDGAGLPLHLGLHAGDVIREEDNVYGGAVNIAARIAAASKPGEVLVSDTVRSLGRTSANVAFDERGEHELKGVSELVRLYQVSGTTGGDAPCS